MKREAATKRGQIQAGVCNPAFPQRPKAQSTEGFPAQSPDTGALLLNDPKTGLSKSNKG